MRAVRTTRTTSLSAQAHLLSRQSKSSIPMSYAQKPRVKSGPRFIVAKKKITAKVREATEVHPSSAARGVCAAPLRGSAVTLLYYNCSKHRNYEIAREVTR